MQRRELIPDSESFHQMISGPRERGGQRAADRTHGIFTRVLRIQFPAMMSGINATAARQFSSMR
jgi:hypothetical protein